MYELHRNAVLTGTLNCFCLVCDSFLPSGKEARDHITTISHLKKVGEAQHPPQFVDDHIWKVKWGYYCEFCNVLMPILAMVTFHNKEEDHQLNKAKLLLKPSGKDVIAFNNILIEENIWHSLIEDHCLVCKTEFNDRDEHVNNAKHCLNLVQNPVKFEKNGIYRTVFNNKMFDDPDIFCLTCKTLVLWDLRTEHFNDKEHHLLYMKCQINDEQITNRRLIDATINAGQSNNMKFNTETTQPKNLIKNNDDDDDGKKKESNDSIFLILNSISKYQRESININFETDTAYCRKCSVVIEFDHDNIERHVKEHSDINKTNSKYYPVNLDKHLLKENVNEPLLEPSLRENKEPIDFTNGNIKMVLETSTQDDDVKSHLSNNNASTSSSNESLNNDEKYEFATANNITYNIGNPKAFCRTCQVRFSSLLSSMKEHVVGAVHRKALQKLANADISEEKSLTRVPLERFIETLYTVTQNLRPLDRVINMRYCIKEYSFQFIIENGSQSKHRCVLCSVDLPTSMNVNDHVSSITHERALVSDQVYIITSISGSEFIREIRPGFFHCGFCNLMLKGWKTMKMHIDCSDHRAEKMHSCFRLQIHLPRIHQHRMQERMMFFMTLGGLKSMFSDWSDDSD